MKKLMIICALVLCMVLMCSTAMAASYSFDFDLKSGGSFGIGRVTTARSSAHNKADGEGCAYVTPTSRSFGDTRDELHLYIVKTGESTAQTQILSVKSSRPSLNVKQSLDYTGSYTVNGSYQLYCNAITLWKDASVGGRWTP